MSKIIKIFILIFIILLCCSTIQAAPPLDHQEVLTTTSIVLNPRIPPPPVDLKELVISDKNTPLDRKGGRAVYLAREWINRPIMPTIGNTDGAVIYTFGATMPILVCRPLRVCAIQLEIGERIVDIPRSGDTVRWEIIPSAPYITRPQHIYVKPLDSGLTTNLIIKTDRRTYVIGLKSRNDSYTPLIAFRYPENEKRAWQEAMVKQELINKEQAEKQRVSVGRESISAKDLCFNYTITGTAKWRPLRVFNDGWKTYLQMPEIMKMYEAPVLLTMVQGEKNLVNYRLHGDLFIVDQLFYSAVLISGVGRDQTKITITRN